MKNREQKKTKFQDTERTESEKKSTFNDDLHDIKLFEISDNGENKKDDT